jgi:hypothetical protein
MSRIDRFSRRSLLKGLGMGPALLPMLEVERAFAACAGASGPKRTFILVWPDGMIAKTASSWATTGVNFTLPPHMAALEPYRSDLLLLDGLDYDFIRESPNPTRAEVSGHACFQGMLTGKFYQSFGSSTATDVAGGISLDQYLGNALRAGGYKGIPTLNLQAYSRSTARLSWIAAGQPVLPNYDPFNVFSSVFGGVRPPPVTMPPPGTMTPPPTVDKARLMRRSVLDCVVKDLMRFSASVGAADRVRIDSHLTFVRDMEMNLQDMAGGTGAGGVGGTVVTQPTSGACGPPALGPTLAAAALRQSANFPAISKMMIDIAVGAFAADATRIVVLQLGDQANPDIVFTNLGFVDNGVQDGNTGGINAMHSVAHRNGAEKVKIDTWFMEQAAYAIGQLKNVTDGAKTLLDNTAFLAMNNMRTGIHEFTGVPAIMAGSCGGYFKTGRSLALTGVRNNNVLCAIGNAMGVPTPTFGEAQYGGELTALKG